MNSFRYLFCFLLITLSTHSFAQSKLGVGLTAGAKWDFYQSSSTDDNLRGRPEVSFIGGANFNYALTEKFHLETGFLYQTYSEVYSLKDPFFRYNASSVLTTLQIPLVTRPLLADLEEFKIYGVLGAAVSFQLAENIYTVSDFEIIDGLGDTTIVNSQTILGEKQMLIHGIAGISAAYALSDNLELEIDMVYQHPFNDRLFSTEVNYREKNGTEINSGSVSTKGYNAHFTAGIIYRLP